VTCWYVTVSSAKERVRVGVKRFCYFHSSGWRCWCSIGTVIGIARMAKGRTVFVNTQRIRGTALVARLVGCYIHCLVFSLVEPRPRYGLLAPHDAVLVTPVTIGCLAPLVESVTCSHKDEAYVEVRVLRLN